MEDIAHKRLVQKYYAERAKDYDRQKIRTWKSARGFGVEIIDEVTGAIAGLKDKAVLEVGVGSGRIGFPLLEKVKPWFVGLDLSRKMIELARVKMFPYKRKFELLLGDAEHLPFTEETFEAVFCISTMHYLADSERTMNEFSRVLKQKGILVYGDLMLHESDNRGFLNTLEKTISNAHGKYSKPSEIERLLEKHGFLIFKTKTISYRKSYPALIEDKGEYFDVKLETLHEITQGASADERKLYALGSDGLTLFYTLVIAPKEKLTSVVR
jgi:ubiquinone/menaquinone biosynthesis C-methylase UbiE